MKKAKKLLAIIAAISVVSIVSTATAVFAAETPTLSVGAPDSVSVGDTITVELNLSSNSDLTVLSTDINYDATQLEYVQDTLKMGGLFLLSEMGNPDISGKIKYSGVANVAVNGGTVFSASFKVLKAPFNISITPTAAYDSVDADVLATVKTTEKSVACKHQSTEWKVVTPPTCAVEGTENNVCTDCLAVIETRTISTVEHTYGEWAVVTAPSCTAEGSEKNICTVCDTEETRAIPATGHTYGEWTVVTAPSCTVEGSEKNTCTVCNAEETRAIPATGHTPDEWVIDKAASCTQEGNKTAKCTACGEVYSETIAMIPHDFGEWIIDKEATSAEEGAKHRVCSQCQSEEKSIIEKLDVVETEATTQETTDNGETSIPDTGINSSAPVAILATISALSCAIVLVLMKKKKIC